MTAMKPKNQDHSNQLPGNDSRREHVSGAERIEKAFYTRDTDRAFKMMDQFDRIYFGCEFCDRSLPLPSAVLSMARLCHERKKGFTLVTPLSTDEGIARVKKQLAVVKDLSEIEVVINDWGALQIVKPHSNIVPVAGRLLVKQKSDPRLTILSSKSMKTFFKKTAADNTQFVSLLKEYGIKRIDLDKPLIGVELPRGFEISLHHPFVFLTLSMDCYEENCRACRERIFRLRSCGMPVDILLRGNAQFYRNEDMSPVKRANVSRLIVSEMPLR